jgi:hypothetical protein
MEAPLYIFAVKDIQKYFFRKKIKLPSKSGARREVFSKLQKKLEDDFPSEPILHRQQESSREQKFKTDKFKCHRKVQVNFFLSF